MFKQLFDRIINQPKVPTNEEEEPERYLVTFDNIGEVLNSDLGKGNEKISKVLESIEGQRYLSEKDKDALWHACDVAQWRYDIYNEKMRKRVVAEHFDNMCKLWLAMQELHLAPVGEYMDGPPKTPEQHQYYPCMKGLADMMFALKNSREEKIGLMLKYLLTLLDDPSGVLAPYVPTQREAFKTGVHILLRDLSLVLKKCSSFKGIEMHNLLLQELLVTDMLSGIAPSTLVQQLIIQYLKLFRLYSTADEYKYSAAKSSRHARLSVAALAIHTLQHLFKESKGQYSSGKDCEKNFLKFIQDMNPIQIIHFDEASKKYYGKFTSSNFHFDEWTKVKAAKVPILDQNESGLFPM